MSYFDKGKEYELNNDITNAKYYYNLAVLQGDSIGLKKLEYLDKDVIRYMKKYHSNPINTDFIHIINYWFGYKFNGYKIIYDFCNEISSTKIQEYWINLWFAKNDDELKMFEKYYDKYKSYDPTYLYEYIALIILYDQIPRNIFRNTPKAYETDNIAFKYASFLKDYIEFLPFHVCIFIILSYCHQESLDVHLTCKNMINIIKEKHISKYYNIFSTLYSLFENHYDRIKFFGRIPERNFILGRISTEKEIVYMKNL